MVVTADTHTTTVASHDLLFDLIESVGGRASLYTSRWLNLPAGQVQAWEAAGHEIGLHPYFVDDGFANDFAAGYQRSADWFPVQMGLDYGPTVRHHSLEWLGWVTPAAIMRDFGLRMDTSYYAWGPALFNPDVDTQAHGYINGSGQPMRFIDQSGQVIDVFQQSTALVDEQLVTGDNSELLSIPAAVAVSQQLINESQNGSYAAVTTQFHIDYITFGEVYPWVQQTVQYAQAQGVPMWPTRRWLEFTDARYGTAVTDVNWSALDRTLSFRATLPPGSPALTMLVPGSYGGDSVTSVVVGGSPATAPQFVVNGRTMRAITLTRPANGAAILVSVAYAVTTPTVSIGDLSVAEGNSGTTAANLAVTLSAPTANTVTVNFSATPGTATAADYTRAPGSIQIPPGQTAAIIPVTIIGDTLVEGNHEFSVTLSGVTNANLGDAVGIVTIVDDDAPPPVPTLAIADSSVTEGNSGAATASFTVSLSGAAAGPVAVQWATANGTATAASDYTAGSGTVTIPAGQTSQVVSVQVLGDTTVEPNETFTVNLTNPSGATIADQQGVGTIVNDDTAGGGTTTATYAVLSGADDVNEDGTSFTAGSGSVWIGSGSSTTGSVAGLRFANVTIPAGAVVSSARVELRSTASQWLSLNFTLGVEAAANSAPFTTASRPSQRPLLPGAVVHASNVQWLANTTYQLDQLAPLVQSVIGLPGWASGNALSVVVRGTGGAWARKFATAFEGGAAFAPRLVVTYTSGPATPSVSVSDVTVTEGQTGTTSAVFTVSLSAASAQAVTVDYATANGTAQTPGDFLAANGTLTFAPGETSKAVAVGVVGDAAIEAAEQFVLNLSAPSNATIADGQGVGTITNDDLPTLSIGDVQVAEGNSGTTTATFTATLSAASPVQVSAGYSTGNGTATAGQDFVGVAAGSVVFAPNVTSQTIQVLVNGDTTVEPDENFTVTLAGPQNATLADFQGQGTITNDDSTQPVLAIGPASVTEGNGPGTALAFTVTLTPAATQQVTVNYAAAAGSATLGADFSATSGALIFAVGETSKVVSVPVVGETLPEGNETLTVTLSGAVGATIGTATATGTIVNDDPPALSISDATVTEGNAGTTSATFTLTLSPPSPTPVAVTYATANGTATAGSDYVGVASTPVTIPANTAAWPVTVAVLGDTTIEGAETFLVNLSSPSGATLVDSQGVGTITNDDGGAPVSVTVSLPIAAGADDVNETANVLAAGDSTAWVGTGSSAAASFAGFRFANVTIPAGATITSARLEVNAANTQWTTIAFEFAVEASPNSAAFTATARPSQRALLPPRQAHSSNAQWVAGTWYQLEQIAPLLQAAINQPGWASGNAVALVLRGTGSAWGRKFLRTFEAGAATASRLVVTYQVAP
jgi:hypothetical protein